MQKTEKNKLYYIHDPMCSWCWGFHQVWQQLEQQLAGKVAIQYLLGGLAIDSASPMSEEMQLFLQQTWRTIGQEIPGTKFNFNFWSNCQPRRSTYPACRAVIAAKNQNTTIEKKYIEEIQKAYYLNAQNPSDDDTLIKIAGDLDLDKSLFINDLNSEKTQQALLAEIQFVQQLGVQGFPSLVFENKSGRTLLNIDYNNAENILQQLNELSSQG